MARASPLARLVSWVVCRGGSTWSTTALAIVLALVPTLARADVSAPPGGGGGGPADCTSNCTFTGTTTLGAVVTGAITASGPITLSDGAGHLATLHLSFPTYAAFIAYNPATIGATMVTATTAGYYAAGDGGASTYDWSASSTATPDPATKGPTYGTAGIFTVQPTPTTGAGRWLLRLPDNTIHPEQAGAKCDSVTNDINPLQNLAGAITATASLVYGGTTISLNPNKFCLLAVQAFSVANGIVIRGAQSAFTQSNSANAFDPYGSGFIVDTTNSRISMGTGATLSHLTIMRRNLPDKPLTYQDVMAPPHGVVAWAAENGYVSNVAVTNGGAGCFVDDVMTLNGGNGNTAWIKITAVSAGVATAVQLVDPGAYYVFPTSPNLTINPKFGTPTHCTTLPTVTFTAGTAMSTGIISLAPGYVEDVAIVGFNTALFAGGLQATNITMDAVNGADFSQNGAQGFYQNLGASSLWAASAMTPVQSNGVYTVTSIATGGTLNQVGDVLSTTSGTCVTTPKVTVDAVDGGGAVTAAHVTTWGDCTVTPTTNPHTMTNLHAGTAATLHLLWTTADYKPGRAYYIHDTCTACTFVNLTSHGQDVGLDMSNNGFVYLFGLNLEPSSYVNKPAPPVGRTIGIHLRNCLNAQIYSATVNNFWTGIRAYHTGWEHAPMPGLACGTRGAPESRGGSAVQIWGGSIGSSFADYRYAVDIGPYSRGMLSALAIFTPTTAGAVAVNVGANIYGWALRDIAVAGSPTATGNNWLKVDPTSLANLIANAIPTGDFVPVPRYLMGGIPTSCTGQPVGTLANTAGTMTICP